MPFCWSAMGGLQERNIDLESVTVATKLVGGPEGAERK